MSVFKYLNYKDVIKNTLREKKHRVSAHFNYDRMAKACHIQKTYMSRVLNSDDSHLSEEQLFLAAKYLGLTKEEIKYLQLLRSWQRSTSATYKAELQYELDAIRQSHDRSEYHLSAEAIESATDLAHYYLDPNVMLVHIFLTVDRFRKDPKLLGSQLNLSPEYLTDIFTKLEQMHMIKLSADGYTILKESTHLSLDSPFFFPYRCMQRVKSLDRIQKIAKDATYNFSVVFSADEPTRRDIKAKFLDLLKLIEKTSRAAPAEEVYQLNFDLFDWSCS